MERFTKDLQKLLIKTDDSDNKWAYSSLLLFCEFHNEYIKDETILENIRFIKSLYAKYHFGGVQREKNDDIEILCVDIIKIIINTNNEYKKINSFFTNVNIFLFIKKILIF